MLSNIRTVLIHNSHPGNIGSAARAMKNMGLENMYLVAPRKFPSKEAFYMASKADDVVERAKVVENVHQALEGCTLVLATSSRSRALKWPEVSPRLAAAKIIEEIQHPGGCGKVGILYGCEQSGLSNEDLELSHYQIIIPAEPLYSSLNIAQAVQLISYEIYVRFLEVEEQKSGDGSQQSNLQPPPTQGLNDIQKEAAFASQEDMQRFYQHLEETLLKIEFIAEDRPGLMMSRLRRLFTAARLDKIELQILRGILTAIQRNVYSKTT